MSVHPLRIQLGKKSYDTKLSLFQWTTIFSGDVELSRVVVPFKPQNLRILPVTAPTDRIRELLNRVVTDFQKNVLRMHPNYDEADNKNPFDKQYDNVIEGTVVQVQVGVSHECVWGKWETEIDSIY